jgi:hypothetical protein
MNRTNRELYDCREEHYIVWELQAEYFYWFLSGTFCRGKKYESWSDRVNACRECKVFKSMPRFVEEK